MKSCSATPCSLQMSRSKSTRKKLSSEIYSTKGNSTLITSNGKSWSRRKLSGRRKKLKSRRCGSCEVVCLSRRSKRRKRNQESSMPPPQMTPQIPWKRSRGIRTSSSWRKSNGLSWRIRPSRTSKSFPTPAASSPTKTTSSSKTKASNNRSLTFSRSSWSRWLSLKKYDKMNVRSSS